MLNPKLKEGDRIRLLHMDGESLFPGTWGTVRSVFKDLDGSDAYYVDWDDGNKENKGKKISNLNLYSTTDAWDFGGKPKKPIEEKWSEKYKKSIDCNNPKGFSQKAHCQGRKKRKVNEDKNIEMLIRNSDVIKYFKINGKNYLLDLVKFLKLLRKSGVVNMLTAAPFLYMGREYMDRHYGDSNVKDDEYFEEVLDLADEVRNIMIMVTMNLVEDKYKIDTDEYDNDEDENSKEQNKILNLANKHIKDLANRVLQIYLISF